MSELPPQSCPQCQAPFSPGQRLCRNCGAAVSGAGVVPSTPNSNASPVHKHPGYTAQAPNKSLPLSWVIVGILVVLLIVGYGGFIIVKNSDAPVANNGDDTITGAGHSATSSNTHGNGGSSFPVTQTISLSVVYSSVQMDFTKIEQASKFADDDVTTRYTTRPNYVRINFKERNQSKSHAFYSYLAAFHLLLPDNTVEGADAAADHIGPEQSVVRDEWVDFGTSEQVDLSKLTLQLGSESEAQMQFPLKTGADVSKYQPRTATLNKSFNYAHINWTLQRATHSLYFDGQQALTDKVYITVQLVASNYSNYQPVLFDFIRLKYGEDAAPPDNGSDLDNFELVRSGTINAQGSATFLVPVLPASTTYTLQFLSNSNYTAQSVDFQIQ